LNDLIKKGEVLEREITLIHSFNTQ